MSAYTALGMPCKRRSYLCSNEGKLTVTHTICHELLKAMTSLSVPLTCLETLVSLSELFTIFLLVKLTLPIILIPSPVVLIPSPVVFIPLPILLIG
jgi:hypothetical protein